MADDHPQRAIRRGTERIPNELVAELAPSRRALLWMLVSDNPRRYREMARALGMPAGGLCPTRTRALHQLHGRLH